MPTFTTTLQTDVETGNARYIVIPPEVVEALGGKSRIPVRGTLNGIPFQNSLAAYSGVFVIPVKSELRQKARLKVGSEVEVVIEVDTERHLYTVPEDVTAAFSAHPAAQVLWDALSVSQQRRHVNHINEAKQADTRARRIQKMVLRLSEGIEDGDVSGDDSEGQ